MKLSHRAVLIIILIAGATQGLAQQKHVLAENKSDSIDHHTVINYSRPIMLKTNLAGPFSVLFEVQLYPRRTLQMSINRVNFGFLSDEDKYFMFTTAFKFYLTRKESTERRPGPAGFYFSPCLRYVNVIETTTGLFSDTKLSEVAYNLFGGGVTAGYQLIFRKGFILDFFAGGGYLPFSSSKVQYVYMYNYDAGVNSNDYKADFRLGICIGYAFK